MPRLPNGLRNRGCLVRGVHVLVVDRDLGAVDDVERVAGFLSRGQIALQHLGPLRAGWTRAGVATECGQRAGEAVRGKVSLVLDLRLVDGAQRLDGRGLVRLGLHADEVRDSDQHQNDHDGHDDKQFHQGEAALAVAAD